MEDPAPIPPVSHKRPLEEDVAPPTTPVKAISSIASSPLSVRSVKTPSPVKAASAALASITGTAATPSTSAQQPAKRRKLTQKEKDDLKLEKEAKAKAREEKKALRDAEDKLKAEQKAQRDEEKRQRDEEKQKKVEEREEKRRQKEEEQQQKEEEKAKKERSQMKLNAFFVKPKGTGVSSAKASVESSQKACAPSVSLSDVSPVLTNSATSSPQKNIINSAQSDYEKYFLPFNLPAHTILAPVNYLMEDVAKVEAARTRLDKLIAQENASSIPTTIEQLKQSLPKPQRVYRQGFSIAEVVESVNNSSERPIDLTDDEHAHHERPQDMLKEISMKYLHFSEDVRPPYFGTYTQAYTAQEASRLARNPLCRLRHDTNYDYDSEAEWEEPEEGEDLDSEDDEDAGDDVEDDMDGFLDDEEDPQLKRRMISGDLQPISTGLCWQDRHGVSHLNDGSGAICTDFRGFAMGFLLHPEPTSIDPFSTAYWAPEALAPASSANQLQKDVSNSSTMNPPRAPLTQRTMNGLLNTLNSPSKAASGSTSKPVKAKRMIPTEQLSDFKAEIDGKDLTKIGMIEALKKVFPKLPKDAIANTLSVVAARVGPTEKEKRWVLINS